MTVEAPEAHALLMATAMARSLNEPLGLHVSSFSSRRIPLHPKAAAGASISGVSPSPNDTSLSSGTIGRSSRQRPIPPGRCARSVGLHILRRVARSYSTSRIEPQSGHA